MTKPLRLFPPKRTHRDGRASWCHACVARRRRTRREVDPGWRRRENVSDQARRLGNGYAARRSYNARYPDRRAARRKLWRAVKTGQLVKPTRCEDCGKRRPRRQIHGHHHRGYDRPLDVKWVCAKCHGVDHRKIA